MKANIILIPAILLLFSCAGKTEKGKENESVKVVKEPPVVEQQADLSDHPGQPLYTQHCLPCHQADGNGVPGMYPPIVETKWVNGDNKTLISIVVHGMDEEIEVNGEFYNTIMAPLPHLSDQQVSDVLNYVRRQFGSSTEKITPEEVKIVRENES
ncbi:MAG: cytochrome c [Bacteroidales bacterium]|nr:cytochrome c [Bacteroidales bacterium]